MDVARLRYEIDSSQAKTAKDNLGGMTKAARDAERAKKGLGSASTKAGRDIKAANDNIARSATAAAKSFRLLSSAIAPIGAAIAAAFSLRPLIAFKDAMAEVSTLVDTTTFDMARLEKAAIAQSAAFGGSAADQARAFYQIISAGASSAAQATEILTAANKLAVGGVTDVTTAADGLTSVLNAYGSKVEGATAVSDALFVGMRAGKTTIGQLASSLGKVAPLAAQTGVSFDELVAGVSALTKGGISTTEAVTGVRAVLAAVAKPTTEAAKLAKALGLEFNAAALQSKGFAGFLQDIVAKTGGSTDALSQLFGGVEALVPIMALSGQAGKDFTAILEQMGIKAGATEEAFTKMAMSPGFQAGRVWSSLQAEVLGLTSALAGPLTRALKFVADNMDRIVIYFVTASAVIGTRFVAALAVAAASTFSFSSALIFLRGALIRSGVGALIVGAGELVYQFSRLVEAAGGFGAALGLLKDVAVEAWDRIKLGAESLVQSMDAGWEGMKASFFYALHDMTAGFANFINSVASGLNTVFKTNISTNLMENVLADLNAAGNNAMVASYSAQRSANGLMDQATAPLQSLEAIKKVMEDAAAKTDGTTEAIKRLEEALGQVPAGATAAGGAMSDAAKKAKDAWQKMHDAIKSAVGDLGQSVGGIFRGLIDGTTTWKDAALQAINSVIKYLNSVNVAKGGSGIFGGGFLQSLIGGFLGIGFASGGYTGNGPTTKAAGVVHGQEFVMNAGATAKYRPQLEAMNSGRPVNNNQRPASNQNVHVSTDVTVKVEDDGKLTAVVDQRASKITQQGLSEYDKTLPTRVGDIVERTG